MAGQNRVSVILDAIDKLTPVLNGLSRSTEGLSASAVFVGNVYTMAFQKAAEAVGQINTRFQEASNMQNAAIGQAGQFSAMTGKSYGDAGKMISEMNAAFADMAAKLPGATQDYKDLGMAISDTLIKSNTKLGVFNEQAYKDQTMALTRSLGLLKATNSELQISDVQLFFTKFVEGASESELKILKLNERMPGLMGELEKAQKKLGLEGQKLEKLGNDQKAKIFEIAAKALTPPEMIRDLERTAASQMEGFKTMMFDQNTGIFGFLRQVKSESGKAKSVMDGFSALLTAVLGEGGLFATASKALSALGFGGIDPMLALYEGLMVLTGWAKKTGDFLRGLTLPNLTKLSPERLGQIFADTIDDALAKIGQMSTQIDYGAIARAIGGGIGAAGRAIWSFLTNLNWQTYLAAGLAVIGTMLAGGLLVAIGGAIAAAVAAVAGLPLLVIAGVGLLTIAAGKAIVDNWGTITTTWNNFWSWVGSSVTNLINTSISGWQMAIDTARNTLKSAIDGMWDRITSTFNNLVSAISGWFQSQVAKIQSVLTNPIGTIQGAITGQPVTNNASGLNAGSLLSAIAREASAMPTGANLAIANTSEAILNRSQQQDLVSLVSGMMRPQSSGVTFSPQVVVNPGPGMDVSTLADEVMRRIEQKWQEFQLSSM